MRKQLPWALLAILGNAAYAQWLNYPTPGIPRTRDGKPNLAARAPRASNGKPDLSGVWRVEATPLEEQKRLFGNDIEKLTVPGMERDKVSKYAFNILLDFKPEDSPMRPEAAALLRQRQAQPDARPSTHCLPAGIPSATLFAEVQKIVQTPGLIVMMLELDNAHRQIYTDGRKLPADPEPLWLGYSVGKWEGDTLVVESTGFNDKTWLDGMGHPHSEAMRVVERYRRRDFGHLDVEITIDDPKMYTQPFTIKVTHLLQADSDILEYFCAENEKDSLHMVTK
ncbi:MAG TPA: hypothetical protein VN841_20275 [Bryobacteraceae bacterium]|nr:hypothetical protein [Bryobacteraceae bacterium]